MCLCFILGLREVFKWLVNKKGRNVSNIEEICQRFPDEGDLEFRIRNCKNLFWTGYVDSKLEIRPKLEVRLCAEYQQTEGKCNEHCGKLHLCRFNLLSPQFCSSPCQNNLSHSIVSEHNKSILYDALPITMRGESYVKQIQMLIRSSLPRLCKSFQEDGVCHKDYCGYLHICVDNLDGSCQGKCKQAAKSGVSKSIVHDFRSGHNAVVLQNFGYERKGVFFKEELLHNLLLPKDKKITPEKRNKYDSDSDHSDISSVSGLSGKPCEDRHFHQGMVHLNFLYISSWLCLYTIRIILCILYNIT